MTIDRASTRPPEWAEALLRLLLKPEDRESVSGDLLEEYRQTAVPARGKGADAWYVRQVAGFLWRTTWIWSLLFSALFVSRTAYDWLVPTTQFATRSAVSTWSGVAVLFIAAAWSAWRSRSVVSGLAVAAITSQIAAVMSVAGAAILLAIWHDQATLLAIAGSGGLEEVFVLPFMMIVPAVIVGSVAGAAASLSRRICSSFVG
jgi:hypothetical protein